MTTSGRQRLALGLACILACCLPILLLGAGVTAVALLSGLGALGAAAAAVALVVAAVRLRRHGH